MTETAFVYVTYISAKQEQVWKGLLDSEFTRKYWEHDNVFDWKPGSRWEHKRSDGSGKVDMVGKVVESTPSCWLVMTWAWLVEEQTESAYSWVTIELQLIDDMVRLTVTHDRLGSDTNMLKGISEGWPRVLSSLKSLLETGKPLPTWAKVKS